MTPMAKTPVRLPYPCVFRVGMRWRCRIQGGGIPTYDIDFWTKRQAANHADWMVSVITILWSVAQTQGGDEVPGE